VLPVSFYGWGRASDAEEFHVDPTVNCTIKDGNKSAKNGAPEKLRYRTNQKEVS